jgi:hypothetical protein
MPFFIVFFSVEPDSQKLGLEQIVIRRVNTVTKSGKFDTRFNILNDRALAHAFVVLLLLLQIIFQ